MAFISSGGIYSALTCETGTMDFSGTKFGMRGENRDERISIPIIIGINFFRLVEKTPLITELSRLYQIRGAAEHFLET